LKPGILLATQLSEEATVRKVELIQAVYEVLEGRESRFKATDLVDAVFAEMKRVLAQGEEIKIAGFGVFQIRDKATRVGRNPQTGEPLVITPRRIVRFKTSTVLKGKLNEPSKETS
jgi:integration host factor subunit alpha